MKKTISLNQRELINVISESVRHILSEGTMAMSPGSVYERAAQFIKDVYYKNKQTAAQIQKQYKKRIMPRSTFIFNERNLESIPKSFIGLLSQMRDNASKGLLKVGINNDGTFKVFLLRAKKPGEIFGGSGGGSSW